MNGQHYCKEHKSKFYKNEKLDGTGQLKVWYSHKLADGSGFCQEEDQIKNLASDGEKMAQLSQNQNGTGPVQLTLTKATDMVRVTNSTNGMFMCNAMNNAVSLASNGVIPIDQIGSYYRRILAEFYTPSV
jgi:hypothetical protein